MVGFKADLEKGLLYKGFKIVPYCPRCGTPLSSHEVAQGYKDVKERSAIGPFPREGRGRRFPGMDPTPWDPALNVALCVNPVEEYVKVKMNEDGQVYYLAHALCDTVLEKAPTPFWKPMWVKTWNIRI